MEVVLFFLLYSRSSNNVLYTGSRQGLIPNCLYGCSKKLATKGELHDEMNFDVVPNLFKNTLLRNLLKTKNILWFSITLIITIS